MVWVHNLAIHRQGAQLCRSVGVGRGGGGGGVECGVLGLGGGGGEVWGCRTRIKTLEGGAFKSSTFVHFIYEAFSKDYWKFLWYK